MAVIKFKPLSEEYVNGRQSIEYKGVFDYGKHKIKLEIDRDSHDPQSSARAYIFANLKWELLDSIPYQLMALKNVSYVLGNSHPSARTAFQKDILTLQTKVRNILG